MMVGYLHYADAWTYVDEHVGVDARVDTGEAVFGVGVPLVDEHFIGDVLQKKVAAFDQAGHLFFLVDTEGKDEDQLIASIELFLHETYVRPSFSCNRSAYL